MHRRANYFSAAASGRMFRANRNRAAGTAYPDRICWHVSGIPAIKLPYTCERRSIEKHLVFGDDQYLLAVDPMAHGHLHLSPMHTRVIVVEQRICVPNMTCVLHLLR